MYGRHAPARRTSAPTYSSPRHGCRTIDKATDPLDLLISAPPMIILLPHLAQNTALYEVSAEIVQNRSSPGLCWRTPGRFRSGEIWAQPGRPRRNRSRSGQLMPTTSNVVRARYRAMSTELGTNPNPNPKPNKRQKHGQHHRKTDQRRQAPSGASEMSWGGAIQVASGRASDAKSSRQCDVPA